MLAFFGAILALGISFAVGIVYSSFFEWALHRFLMHSTRFMKYPHRAHQIEHHGIFRADETYFLPGDLHTKEDEKHLTFAWWNAPLLFLCNAPIFLLAGWLFGPLAFLGSSLAMAAYYSLYEYLHFCMHVPADRWLERTRFFQFIQAHHRMHHVYFRKNLNVVLPIADTILRSRVPEDKDLYAKLEQVRQRRAQHTKPELQSVLAAGEERKPVGQLTGDGVS